MALTLGDIIRVTARCILQGEDIVQVWHYRLDQLFVDLATMISEIRSALSGAYATIASYQTIDLSAGDIAIHNLTQDETYGLHTWPVAYGGGTDAINEQLPPPVSALVLSRTYQSRVRGRKFFSGFTEQNLADGLWGAGVQTAVLSVVNELCNGRIEGPPGILEGGVYSTVYLELYDPYESASSNNPAYQRRRRIGRGS